MGRLDFSEMTCSVARTLEVVGDRWTLLILRDAFYGLRRFDEFSDNLGLSRNILTDRLNKLVGHGVMEKVAYQRRPTRYSYVLTEKGRALLGVVLAMMAWGDSWEGAGATPPVRLDHRSCGAERITPQVACPACGEALRLGDVRARPVRIRGAREQADTLAS